MYSENAYFTRLKTFYRPITEEKLEKPPEAIDEYGDPEDDSAC